MIESAVDNEGKQSDINDSGGFKIFTQNHYLYI
jgi:hypothetical protein